MNILSQCYLYLTKRTTKCTALNKLQTTFPTHLCMVTRRHQEVLLFLVTQQASCWHIIKMELQIYIKRQQVIRLNLMKQKIQYMFPIKRVSVQLDYPHKYKSNQIIDRNKRCYSANMKKRIYEIQFNHKRVEQIDEEVKHIKLSQIFQKGQINLEKDYQQKIKYKHPLTKDIYKKQTQNRNHNRVEQKNLMKMNQISQIISVNFKDAKKVEKKQEKKRENEFVQSNINWRIIKGKKIKTEIDDYNSKYKVSMRDAKSVMTQINQVLHLNPENSEKSSCILKKNQKSLAKREQLKVNLINLQENIRLNKVVKKKKIVFEKSPYKHFPVKKESKHNYNKTQSLSISNNPLKNYSQRSVQMYPLIHLNSSSCVLNKEVKQQQKKYDSNLHRINKKISDQSNFQENEFVQNTDKIANSSNHKQLHKHQNQQYTLQAWDSEEHEADIFEYQI